MGRLRRASKSRRHGEYLSTATGERRKHRTVAAQADGTQLLHQSQKDVSIARVAGMVNVDRSQHSRLTHGQAGGENALSGSQMRFGHLSVRICAVTFAVAFTSSIANAQGAYSCSELFDPTSPYAGNVMKGGIIDCSGLSVRTLRANAANARNIATSAFLISEHIGQNLRVDSRESFGRPMYPQERTLRDPESVLRIYPQTCTELLCD